VRALARYRVPTGALSPAVILLLKELAKAAQGTDGVDSTVYGLGRASPQSFFLPPPTR
jgi:hypothetical protein